MKTRYKGEYWRNFQVSKGPDVDADYTYGANNEHIHQTGGKVTAWDFWAGGGQLNYLPYTSATYDRATYGSAWDRRNVVKALQLTQRN